MKNKPKLESKTNQTQKKIQKLKKNLSKPGKKNMKNIEEHLTWIQQHKFQIKPDTDKPRTYTCLKSYKDQ